MNIIAKMMLVAIPSLALVINANAHDPKEHAKMADNTEQADCSKLHEMMDPAHMKDMKNMDKEGKTAIDKQAMAKADPVMMAIMKKCHAKLATAHDH